MSPDLEGLVRLQQLDATMEDARRAIAAHPQRLADADARLDAAKERLDAVKERLNESQESRRSFEKEAAAFQARLTKFKDQLLDVKTNREYQAVQHEIATAQHDLGAAEERVLERMMEADAVALEVTQAEAALAADQAEVAREKVALERELASQRGALDAAAGARAALIAGLDPRLVALYDQVAKARKGVAICSATREGTCSVCHVRLRPQVFQIVRQNDTIVQCESCQRILYYTPPAAPVAAPATHA